MKISKLKYERTLLVITILCEVIAYLLALTARYVVLTPFYTNTDRFYSFYRVFAGVVIAVRVVLFYYYMRSEERIPVWKQETIEIIATAVKQHFLLLILLTLFLYFAKWSAGVSRTVMGLLILFGIVLDIISRKLYCSYCTKHYASEGNRLSVVLVACENEKASLEHAINAYGLTDADKDIQSDCSVKRIVSPEEAVTLTAANNVSETVYVSGQAYSKLSEKNREALKALSCPVMYELDFEDQDIDRSMIHSAGRSAVVTDDHLSRKCNVLGVQFTVSTLSESARYILRNCKKLAGEYVCFSNVHTTITAYDDPEYRAVLNRAAYVMPDGSPVARRLVASGYLDAERVAGPDFMDRMFQITSSKDITHYFYGSTEETINKLRTELERKYPGIKIAGMYSPPFRELSEEEDREVVKTINDSGASLIWVGLGAPKQEKWMAAHKGKVNGVMFGVGAGFDFHAGTARRAPLLIQKLGLEWLYRLLSDPGRLFKRYFVTNTKFLWLTRKPAE